MTEDHRLYRRLPLRSTVFLELESTAATRGDEPTIVRCTSADVSERGLSLSLDRELAEGAVHQVGIDLADEGFNTVYLAAEVVWCRSEGARWRAGFSVLPASDSDFDRWRALLRHMVDLGVDSEGLP